MMAAGRYDITVEQGTTIDIPINWRDSENVPVDISSYSAALQVRETPQTDVVVEFRSDLSANGFIFLNGSAADFEDGENGNLRIYMSSANSSVLPAFRNFRYDLELTSPSGYVTRLLEGQFTVEAEITR